MMQNLRALLEALFASPRHEYGADAARQMGQLREGLGGLQQLQPLPPRPPLNLKPDGMNDLVGLFQTALANRGAGLGMDPAAMQQRYWGKPSGPSASGAWAV